MEISMNDGQKVAVVTGGASRIGRCIAEEFRNRGVKVYPSDTHAFDMLYPERRESQLAAQRFTAQFARRFAAPK